MRESAIEESLALYHDAKEEVMRWRKKNGEEANFRRRRLTVDSICGGAEEKSKCLHGGNLCNNLQLNSTRVFGTICVMAVCDAEFEMRSLLRRKERDFRRHTL